MMPLTRRGALVWMTLLMVALTGCTGSLMRSRSQSPETTEGEEDEVTTKYVGDFTAPYGTNFVQVECAVLITGLANTGSDPPPGAQRAAILADMQARGVMNPNQVLASPTTSIAWARGYLPPGVRKGDKIDIEVRVPAQSETTSLRGGWMMEARMKEMAVISGQVHDGHVLAIAQGAVLVDPKTRDSEDPVSQLRGIVLGGGTALKSRSLGLILRDADKSVYLSKQMGDAINRRYHTFLRGMKQGVATPKTDEFIELEIHPRYKYNLTRYIRVIRSIAVMESPQQQVQRLDLLERQLLDPATTAPAALRLEAVGKDAIRVLKLGLESKDPEVRFYAAEALAYLDEPCCVPVLSEAAKGEPAFRAYALTALSALNDIHASDALRDLFDVPSAETRYGAFRALWAMNENDPLLRGEKLGDKFWLHVVPSAGPVMVHVAHSSRPEVVVFGEGQEFKLPIALEAGNTIVVKSQDDGKISVVKLSATAADKRTVVENSVDAVIRGIAEVGGDYPDVVQALQQARANGSMASRFEVDAIPERGRLYDRNRKLARGDRPGTTAGAEGNAAVLDEVDAKSAGKRSADEGDDQDEVEINSTDPLPNLFGGGAPKFQENQHSKHPEDRSGQEEIDVKSLEEMPKTSAKRSGFWLK